MSTSCRRHVDVTKFLDGRKRGHRPQRREGASLEPSRHGSKASRQPSCRRHLHRMSTAQNSSTGGSAATALSVAKERHWNRHGMGPKRHANRHVDVTKLFYGERTGYPEASSALASLRNWPTATSGAACLSSTASTS